MHALRVDDGAFITPGEVHLLLHMHLIPYVSFAGISFGDSESGVLERCGQPQRRRTNHAGEVELNYAGLVVRISPTGGVQEVTASPRQVTIGDEAVPLDALPERLRQMDPDAVEKLGFIISRRFGIAVDLEPDHSRSVSAFTKGRWDAIAS